MVIEDLRKIIGVFNKELRDTAIYNDCYYQLLHNSSLEKWGNVYNIAPVFFNITSIGIQTEMLMFLSRLFEDDKDSWNFNKLLNSVQSNSKALSNDCKGLSKVVMSLRDKISNEQDAIVKLLHQRSKILAHNDYKYFEDTTGETYPDSLSYEDILRLIELGEYIIDKLDENIFEGYIADQRKKVKHSHDLNKLMEFCIKHLKE